MRFWGLQVEGSVERYILCTGGQARGLAFSIYSVWTTKENMKYYWKNSGEYDGHEYYFKPFDTEKELKEWFLDEN